MSSKRLRTLTVVTKAKPHQKKLSLFGLFLFIAVNLLMIHQNSSILSLYESAQLAFAPKNDPTLKDVALLLPTFPGGLPELNNTFLRSLQFFWPQDELTLVIVLDEKVENHTVQEETIRSFLAPELHSSLSVRYNPQDSIERYQLGWLIQQLVMFWADNFTDAPFIGLVDDDAVFTRHVTKYDLFDENDKPRAIVRHFAGFARQQSMRYWNSSYIAYAYKHKSVTWAMSYFPVIMKREHFAEVRKAILDLHPQFACFDDFIYYLVREFQRFSQFQIMMDHMWRTHRDEYSWHFEPSVGDFYVESRGGRKDPDGLPHNESHIHPFIHPGSPAERGITQEMLRPFPRCMMHATYVGRHWQYPDRDTLMDRLLTNGYCVSQPVNVTLRGNKEVAVSSDPIRCPKSNLWDNIHSESLWGFEGRSFGPIWAVTDPKGTKEAYRSRLLRNQPKLDGWNATELDRLFPQ